jgi:hypothetical protein
MRGVTIELQERDAGDLHTMITEEGTPYKVLKKLVPRMAQAKARIWP